MSITLPPHLEAALAAEAGRRGVAPEALAVELLRRQLPPVPIDEWERQLFALSVDCGVSLSDEALSREALYD